MAMTRLRAAWPTVLGAAILASAIAVGYLFYEYGEPVKVFEISAGAAGKFVVGETKESLLTRLPGEAYSPNSPFPRPAECPGAWVEVGAMNSAQRECLLGTDEWEVGDGIKELCPERTDFHATLFFTGNKLAKVRIRCTPPE
jgi:hypothetical protein